MPPILDEVYKKDWKRVARVFLDMIIEACKNELDLLKDEAVPPTKVQKLRVAVNELRGSRKRLREDGGGSDIEDLSNTFEVSLFQETVTRCQAISEREGFKYLLEGGPTRIERQIVENKKIDGIFLQVSELIKFVG